VTLKSLKEQTKTLEKLEAELMGQNTGTSPDQVRSLIVAVLRALNVDPGEPLDSHIRMHMHAPWGFTWLSLP
jgi:hypothetical protein